MRVELMPSAFGTSGEPGSDEAQFLTSILVNDSICLDAGSIGFQHDLAVQRSVEHVFISHSHTDHTASLPMLLDNVFGVHPEGVHVHASKEVESALREDLFNDRTWPDFIRISEEGPQRLLTLHRLVPEKPVEIDGVRITPVPVDHIVPTVGYVVDDGESAIVIATDTGPSDRLWEIANAIPHLRAVFLEVSFPEELTWLADAAKHLTPKLFAEEVAKLTGSPELFVLHLKPTHREDILRQLGEHGIAKLHAMESGRGYTF